MNAKMMRIWFDMDTDAAVSVSGPEKDFGWIEIGNKSERKVADGTKLTSSDFSFSWRSQKLKCPQVQW